MIVNINLPGLLSMLRERRLLGTGRVVALESELDDAPFPKPMTSLKGLADTTVISGLLDKINW